MNSYCNAKVMKLLNVALISITEAKRANLNAKLALN